MVKSKNRQVTGVRLMLAAAGLAALSACGGDCDARLVLVNASGQAIASGTLRSAGSAETQDLGSLDSPGTSEYRFGGIGVGAYAVDIRFADGSTLRDTSLGFLTRGMAFRDTLYVRPAGSRESLDLKQIPRGCREAPRMKTLIREFLKKVIRS